MALDTGSSKNSMSYPFSVQPQLPQSALTNPIAVTNSSEASFAPPLTPPNQDIFTEERTSPMKINEEEVRIFTQHEYQRSKILLREQMQLKSGQDANRPPSIFKQASIQT